MFRRSGGADPGRDGARVPSPWAAAPAPYGFGPVGSAPWLPQPPGWDRYAADRQAADPDSALTLTRTALPLRDSCWRGRPAEVTWLDTPADALAFRRGPDGPVCLVNLGDAPVDWRPYGERMLLSSSRAHSGALPAPVDGLAELTRRRTPRAAPSVRRIGASDTTAAEAPNLDNVQPIGCILDP
ncbi:hypothetical protein ACFY2R_05830 [Micromonospora olivasterospora]|uniref:Alpha-glucosidase n=1 Tax=Micromonospora olivasterospora TaxID=1880 RepID=A0A562II68_MICOL|nr:hypothetical protein [Micromonospora olivasterospora]TWH70518.1 alpha-glucosidase [Micromonospora olivasterospora]